MKALLIVGAVCLLVGAGLGRMTANPPTSLVVEEGFWETDDGKSAIYAAFLLGSCFQAHGINATSNADPSPCWEEAEATIRAFEAETA